MTRHALSEVLALLAGEYSLQGDPAGKYIENAKSILAADESSLAWIDPNRRDKQKLLDATRAAVIVGDSTLELSAAAALRQVLIKVENPKLTMIGLVTQLFESQPAAGIHPSAVIHAEARIAADAHIGPLSCIGKAQIGAGCVIHGSVHIYDNVTIGSNVIIQAGCVIGVAGLSLARDDAGRLHNFPHLGGVVIEDDVEIQALCVIDRGVLDDTVIGRGTKINSSCYIGHNVRIGADNFIAGNTMICGSVRTGDNCWFAPASVVRDQLRIGSGAFVGTGSVVVSSLDENARVMGSPARPIAEAKSILRKLRELSDHDDAGDAK